MHYTIPLPFSIHRPPPSVFTYFCSCSYISIPSPRPSSKLAENEISSVNRAMFKGLSNLKKLDLFSNQISCVTPGAFDELASLTSLNLISNPFNCNCHMAW